MSDEREDLYWKAFMDWSSTLRPSVAEWTKAVGAFEETFAAGYNAALNVAAKRFTDMNGERLFSGEAAQYCYTLRRPW